ncbi:carnitine O-acetyltransferase-like isoform X2 [Parasteatoda tepidariorum]|uniref:carnitine O-acetyltransferase-like isoform X2 n=1 Tax=Parasteatoda tepidariorum TaxID=114398 RepID=UPI00077F8838
MSLKNHSKAQLLKKMRFSRFMKQVRYVPTCRSPLSTYSSSIITFLERNEDLWIHEMSLPRLPVPPLQATLAKYLYSVRPFLSSEEYLKTTNSDELQLNTYFLENRKPLVCYKSPSCGIYYKSCKGDRLWQASRMVAGLLNFKKSIDNYFLPIQIKSDQSDDLLAYYKIFYTCRIPAIPKDKLEFYGLDNEKIKHIIVIHKNQFFSVDVYDNDGNALNENQIEYQLRKVVEMSPTSKNPIGILTTLNRDKWAKTYKLLLQYDHVNRKSLATIQRSLLVVCIDEPSKDLLKPYKDQFNKQVINGGTVEAGGNRWYDKPLQLIVGEHGAFGIIFEISAFNARPLINVFKYVNDYLARNEEISTISVTKYNPKPKKLNFFLPLKALQDIQEARLNLEWIIDNCDVGEYYFDDFETECIKYRNASPDSYMQMALQLAFYKVHHEIAAAYETASTSKFFNGRPDWIRSTSVDSVNFCKEMMNKSSSFVAKAAALKSAIQVHQEHTHQAINGMGIDRHFLGLRKIAEENNMPTPEIFLDPAYSKCSYFRMCGNQVPTKFDISPHQSPLEPDGYTCLYNLHLSPIRFNICAQKGCHETSTADFYEALRETLIEMKTVIDHSKSANL